MGSVRAQIKKRGLNSIFVVPIIKKESVIGSLLLGTATTLHDGISDRVYKLCHLVANISANALENAVLFESMATAKEVFEEVVTRDNLTRLYTHKYFYNQLEKEFSRAMRYNLALSLILFNIDDFRRLNSKYGHMIGDEVLKQVGRLIRSIVRDIDVAARYSGDEFVLLLPNTDKEGARILAQRISTLISEFDYDVLSEERVTVSVGVSSCIGDSPQTFDQLVEWAKKAMIKAKSNGCRKIMVHGQI
jgi:two-component system cell cycle response regulator